MTERQEAVDAGCAWLVGTDDRRIVAEADRILRSVFRFPPDRNPYGDGKASLRVVDELERLLAPTHRRSCDSSPNPNETSPCPGNS